MPWRREDTRRYACLSACLPFQVTSNDAGMPPIAHRHWTLSHSLSYSCFSPFSFIHFIICFSGTLQPVVTHIRASALNRFSQAIFWKMCEFCAYLFTRCNLGKRWLEALSNLSILVQAFCSFPCVVVLAPYASTLFVMPLNSFQQWFKSAWF